MDMDNDKQQNVIIIDKAEVKHPTNAVECNQKQDAGYAVTCDKCSDKRICLWDH